MTILKPNSDNQSNLKQIIEDFKIIIGDEEYSIPKELIKDSILGPDVFEQEANDEITYVCKLDIGDGDITGTSTKSKDEARVNFVDIFSDLIIQGKVTVDQFNNAINEILALRKKQQDTNNKVTDIITKGND